MRCPTCNGRTRVIRTENSDAETIRRRECEICGDRFTTAERTLNQRQPSAISRGQLAFAIAQLIESLGMKGDAPMRQLLTRFRMLENQSQE